MTKDMGCGIICEYNPFHNGHRYQIGYAREKMGQSVVCAMSGNFVQRGEPACMDKKLRASQAVHGGASVVLEIPFPYSSMSAERFARAGVDILSSCGMCSHLLFGSECSDVGALTEIASALLDSGLQKDIQVYQKENPSAGYARARKEILCRKLGSTLGEISTNPNDILGIEYIKAIRSSGSRLIPVAMARSAARGAAPSGTFASSSQIRSMIVGGKCAEAEKYVPDAGVLTNALHHSFFREALHVSLMTKKPEELRGICEINGGLEHAVIKAARTSGSYSEMFEILRCKTLTDAKIRRMLLFAFFGITEKAAKQPVAYTSVIDSAHSEEALELLRLSRKQKQIVVARRASAVRENRLAFEQYKINDLCEHVLKSCYKYCYKY